MKSEIQPRTVNFTAVNWDARFHTDTRYQEHTISAIDPHKMYIDVDYRLRNVVTGHKSSRLRQRQKHIAEWHGREDRLEIIDYKVDDSECSAVILPSSLTRLVCPPHRAGVGRSDTKEE